MDRKVIYDKEFAANAVDMYDLSNNFNNASFYWFD